jgi:hypothetical protein
MIELWGSQQIVLAGQDSWFPENRKTGQGQFDMPSVCGGLTFFQIEGI